MSRFDEVLALFASMEADELDGEEETDAVRDGLAALIAKVRDPQTVGDVAKWPKIMDSWLLRWAGLHYLIDRDATDEYDDLDGFRDFVEAHSTVLLTNEVTHPMNGLELCQWIDATYPYPKEPEPDE